jgi:nitrous oxidase accessory protein NosD
LKGEALISRKRLAVLAAVAAVAVTASASTASARTLVVTPGHSIQKKIDKAHAGDTVVVQAGTYRESLDINKRLELRGQGAVLTEGAPGHGLCNSMPGPDLVGICAHGKLKFSSAGAPKIVHRVRGIEISGFRVRGFSAEGIFAYGTRGLRVHNNRLGHNGGYGLFSLNGGRIHLVHNVARGNGDFGLYVGDSPRAHAVIRNNRTVGNTGGILVRHASIGVIKHNVVAHNCVGIWVLADAPGPTGNWLVAGNRVWANNTFCPPDPDEGGPPLSGIGILVLGAHDTVIRHNVIRGHRKAHPSAAYGGIVIRPGFAGTQPKGVVVNANVALGNRPDINWNGSGGVRFRDNLCRTSRPGSVC